MNYLIHIIIYFDIYAIVALSLNLVVGYCGMLSLAQAVYFAFGGYAYALISLKLGWGFPASVMVAIVVCVVASFALSLPSWRLRGDLFVLASLAVQTLAFSAIYNWSAPGVPPGSWRNLTNGPFGLVGIPPAQMLGISFDDPVRFLWLASGITIVCSFAVWQLTSSPWGRVMVSMRDDELAARNLGKNTRLIKVQAVAIASGLAAVAGALYAAHVNYLDPSSASLDESVLMLCMVLVGGLGNFRGPIIGAVTLVAIPELLRFIDLPDQLAANLRLAIYGVALVLMMRFRPQGLAGTYRIT